MLEEILSRENMTKALRQVERNKGASGIDGMSVTELRPFLHVQWPFLKAEILESKYKPSPVKKVEIPKPGGDKRMLGIPTVLDRLLQQAIAQKLSELYDGGFSENSFGFRPKRSAHQAVAKAQEYLNEGCTKVIEIDMEKFFDKVNHDRLMSRLAGRLEDKRLLKLIRSYLSAGIMENGVVNQRKEGTPQGSPLSPVLSNIVLDELDKELERRGHKFVRYADDLSIYVRSRKAAERVMESIIRYIEKKLKLKVNRKKTKISSPTRSNLLGFSFYKRKGWQIRISDKSQRRLKVRIKQITSRKWSVNLKERITRLNEYTKGWVNYFRIARNRSLLKNLDSWIRFRLRMCIWKAWKKTKARFANLVKSGIDKTRAYMYANTRKGYNRTAHSPILTRTLTKKYFTDLGYVSVEDVYLKW